MNVTEMCASCIHEGYCMGAYKKDHWCGNHIDKGAINRERDQYRNGSIGQHSRKYKCRARGHQGEDGRSTIQGDISSGRVGCH